MVNTNFNHILWDYNQFSGGLAPFFDPSPKEALFLPGTETTYVSIRLFPETVGYMDLQFNAILVVPLAAVSQGVVLGEPNRIIVTVPASRGV